MNLDEKINKIGQMLADIQFDITHIKQVQDKLLKRQEVENYIMSRVAFPIDKREEEE